MKPRTTMFQLLHFLINQNNSHVAYCFPTVSCLICSGNKIKQIMEWVYYRHNDILGQLTQQKSIQLNNIIILNMFKVTFTLDDAVHDNTYFQQKSSSEAKHNLHYSHAQVMPLCTFCCSMCKKTSLPVKMSACVYNALCTICRVN